MAVDTFTPNRNYTLPATGNDVNTWGPLLNANFSAIDSNISAAFPITTTGGTTTLTASNAANLFYNVTGALTSNAVVMFPFTGTFFLAANNTTGAFTLTFSATGGGNSAVLPQGENGVFYSDGTNITLISSTVITVQGAYTQILTFTGATTLTNAQMNSVLEFEGTAPYTVTMPTPTGAVSSLFFNATTGNITLSATGGFIFIGANGTGTATYVLGPNQAVRIAAASGSWAVESPQTTQFAPFDGSLVQAFNAGPAASPTNVPQLQQVVGAGATSLSIATGSRSFGTTFTNNTSRPLFVTISASNNGGVSEIVGTVNGINIVSGGVGGTVGEQCGVSFFVPPSNTYSAAPNAGTLTLITWAEF